MAIVCAVETPQQVGEVLGYVEYTDETYDQQSGEVLGYVEWADADTSSPSGVSPAESINVFDSANVVIPEADTLYVYATERVETSDSSSVGTTGSQDSDVGEVVGYVEYDASTYTQQASEIVGYVEYHNEEYIQQVWENIGYVEYTPSPASAFSEIGEVSGYVEYSDEEYDQRPSEVVGYVEFDNSTYDIQPGEVVGYVEWFTDTATPSGISPVESIEVRDSANVVIPEADTLYIYAVDRISATDDPDVAISGLQEFGVGEVVGYVEYSDEEYTQQVAEIVGYVESEVYDPTPQAGEIIGYLEYEYLHPILGVEFAYVEWECGIPPPPPPPPPPIVIIGCKVPVPNTSARYYITLKNQSGEIVAIFTDWLSLHYQRTINDVWTYSLSFRDNGDARLGLFELDGQVEVWRSIPGTLDWYPEFEGFHRKVVRDTNEKGEKTYESHGVGYNDLLARTTIAYKGGTIRSDKSDAAETVMKEYVDENCTPTGDLTVVGRLNYDDDLGAFLYNSALPGFTVETDGGNGSTWTGSRPCENLLDVLQDIANFSNIDFQVVGTGEAQFEFRTYVGQLGSDRTFGNPDGNVPVVFSIPTGNLQSVEYSYDRISESNAVIVLGKGDASTRTTLTRADTNAIDDSPWNRREVARPATNYDDLYETYSLRTAGDEFLEELRGKETFSFFPLQRPNSLYGVHYFLGDRITGRYEDIERNKRLVSMEATVEHRQNVQAEIITLKFADIPENA